MLGIHPLKSSQRGCVARTLSEDGGSNGVNVVVHAVASFDGRDVGAKATVVSVEPREGHSLADGQIRAEHGLTVEQQPLMQPAMRTA